MGSEFLKIPGGQEALRIRARRVLRGLQLDIKVHETVELLIASWCSTYHQKLTEYGDRWSPVDQTRPILVRELITPVSYALDHVGEELNYTDPRFGDWKVNLSFLRFVGISEGMSVVVQGVYSLEEVTKVVQGIKEEIQKIYNRELASFDIELVITTKEHA